MSLIETAIDALVGHSFNVDGNVLRMAAKVGAAIFPDDGSSAETLFQNAEAALKHAKKGGDRYLLHSSAMTEAIAGKLSLENKLRRALDNEEFVLHTTQVAMASAGSPARGLSAGIRPRPDWCRRAVHPGLEETG